jgi:transcriptional regulator with XRE-family HTH domain
MLKNLGNRIRTIRKEKGITLVELSEKTGVAQATLSRIETGVMTGTLESHMKIAETLGLSLSDLYSDIDQRVEGVSFTGSGAKKIIQLNKNVQIEALTQENPKKKINPFMTRLQGGAETSWDQYDRGAEKFLYVLEGEVKVFVQQTEYTLCEGESLYFDGSLPHKIANPGNQTARIFSAVSDSGI